MLVVSGKLLAYTTQWEPRGPDGGGGALTASASCVLHTWCLWVRVYHIKMGCPFDFKENAVKTLLKDFRISQHWNLNFVFHSIYLGLRVKFW